MDRAAQFAVVCAREALADSGLELGDAGPDRIGVSVGSAVGGHDEPGGGVRRASATAAGSGWSTTAYATPHLYDYLVPSSFAGRGGLGGRRGGAGRRWSPPAAPRASTRSATPVELIREGSRRRDDRRRHRRPDLADHGGLLRRDQGDHAPQRRPGARLAGRSTAPATGSCSARARRCSSWRSCEHARRRGAHDLRRGRRVRHPLQRLPHDRPAARRPGDGRGDHGSRWTRPGSTRPTIDYINAHGSGTKQNDRHETAAFKRSLGEHAYRTPVSSIKSMVGHSLGAIGSIEIAAARWRSSTAWCRRRPTCTSADPECDLDYVPLTAREQQVDAVLTRRQRVRRLPERDGAAHGREQ